MSQNNLPIYAITPFTMTDYPDEIASVAWFAGCNMRCIYCYNKQIVLGRGKISQDEFVSFLDRRVAKLSGVVFSGGECTLNASFLPLAQEVKQRNFKLKVDTNGSNLSALKEAFENGLIDFVALDFKATKEKFRQITGFDFYDSFIKTLDYLINKNANFEVRTSIHADFLNENDISKMAKILKERGYNGVYHLQGFLDTGENFGDLGAAKSDFDVGKISSDLAINLRNFN